jgi:hypothetical protein
MFENCFICIIMYIYIISLSVVYHFNHNIQDLLDIMNDTETSDVYDQLIKVTVNVCVSK